MKPSLVFLISMQFLGCGALAGNGDLAARDNHGWKMDAHGTRVMRSDDGGKSWDDVSPPALVAAAKNVDLSTPPPVHALMADSEHGNPAFPKGPPEALAKIDPMNADVAYVTITIKPSGGKPGTTLYERTTDGGKTWWLAPPEDTRDDAAKPVMFGDSNGWLQKANGKESLLLHTTDGGKRWLDVTPPALAPVVKKLIAAGEDYDFSWDAALCALDEKRAWLSIVPVEMNAVLLEYTGDAGRHWKEISAPIATDYADISFLDEQHGFLLATSGPAFGHQNKNVYATEDGGTHWRKMNVPTLSTGLSYYTTGISFRTATNGWITGTYHGAPDVPVFYTRDGGQTWSLQELPIPADYIGGYGNTFPPVFTGKDKLRGILPVHLVRHDPAPDHYADVNFETDDGGLTWHLPASGVKNISEVRDE